MAEAACVVPSFEKMGEIGKDLSYNDLSGSGSLLSVQRYIP